MERTAAGNVRESERGRGCAGGGRGDRAEGGCGTWGSGPTATSLKVAGREEGQGANEPGSLGFGCFLASLRSLSFFVLEENVLACERWAGASTARVLRVNACKAPHFRCY